jgi:predicted RNase H-like nuclease (RuvC/YqgF family)
MILQTTTIEKLAKEVLALRAENEKLKEEIECQAETIFRLRAGIAHMQNRVSDAEFLAGLLQREKDLLKAKTRECEQKGAVLKRQACTINELHDQIAEFSKHHTNAAWPLRLDPHGIEYCIDEAVRLATEKENFFRASTWHEGDE